MTSSNPRNIRIAVEGCGHGTLDAIYASVTQACNERRWEKIDLLIIGGDFQAVRNAADLNAMAVPVKYREIGDFHEYYSGAKVAPYLTIFIGGNHEASNHMRELYYGGWAAPNIYYLGSANVIRLGALRIAGMSGIWKGYDYRKSHHERLPYNSDDVRSVFHTRELDVRKLLQIRTQVDIGLSHDWPKGVEWLGNFKDLFRQKDLFENDARNGQLGSQAARYVLDHLRPPYWFSAHLHIKYAALIEHPQPTDQAEKARPIPTPKPNVGVAVTNKDEIDLGDDLDDIDTSAQNAQTETKAGAVDEALRAQLPESFRKEVRPLKEPDPPTDITNTTTRFLALDKCLPKRNFLQLLEIPHTSVSSRPDGCLELSYDPEWLAITRVFADQLRYGDIEAETPRDCGKAHYLRLIEDSEKWVSTNIVEQGKLQVPCNFSLTAPIHQAADGIHNPPAPREYSNPQTEAFCRLLDIPNAFHVDESEAQQRHLLKPRPSAGSGRGGGRGGRGNSRGAMRGGYRASGRGGFRNR